MFSNLHEHSDTVNNIIGFPRISHHKLIKLLEGHEGGIITDVSALASRVASLRAMVRSHRENDCRGDAVDAISDLYGTILQQALSLESHINPYVRCAAKADHLLASLSWPLEANDEERVLLADELKYEMENLPGRSCIYMDLTACQNVVGVVASAPGSESRAWFLNKLRKGVRAMEERGWDNPFELLEMALGNDEELLKQFMAVWTET